MPVLPSGRVVGIMSERARFHAARLRLHVTAATAHRDLYPLIDILFEGEETGASSGFHFSGYTLGDMRQIHQWQERDRHFFLEWLRQPAQVRTIEMARQRLLLEQGPPKERVYSYPARLYSLLAIRLAALSMKRATALQWKRTLLNMRRNGLRHEELNWSGLLEFLASQPQARSISLDELLVAIDFEPIQLKMSHELECNRNCHLPFQEVAQRIPAYLLRLAGYHVADNDVGVVRQRAVNPNYRIGVIWPGGHAPLNGQQWFVLGSYGQAISAADKEQLIHASQEEAAQCANQHALKNHALRCDLIPRERYEYMSLHGGEEYREWLVTLPNFTNSLFNGHFYERNILMHMRTKVRTSSSGNRVLFIEELQSDWHQVSERSRRYEDIPHAPFRKEWVSMALKLLLLHLVDQGLDGVAWADAQVHEMRYDKPLAPLRRLYDEELPRALLRLAKPWQGELQRGDFSTRSPWLHAARHKDQWRVEGGGGRFVTRARFDKIGAQAVIQRHSKAVTLSLPMLLLPKMMREHIAKHGMPLFGESYV